MKSRVDIRGGQMTFGQRIELGRILTDKGRSEAQKFRDALKCLHPEATRAELRPTSAKLLYWRDILEGIAYWVKREGAELKYTPTEEEKQAGIAKLSKVTGEMATIMSLAKDYGTDPDDILSWKYAKVFNILFVNLQQHLFRQRLGRVYEKKAEAAARARRRGGRRRV